MNRLGDRLKKRHRLKKKANLTLDNTVHAPDSDYYSQPLAAHYPHRPRNILRFLSELRVWKRNFAHSDYPIEILIEAKTRSMPFINSAWTVISPKDFLRFRWKLKQAIFRYFRIISRSFQVGKFFSIFGDFLKFQKKSSNICRKFEKNSTSETFDK